MADKLTPQQALAVQNRGGTLLVSAAAGSGKTKVLIDRLMLYMTDPVNPANLDEFLIITYTKAAASELRGKIAAKLTERIAQQPENRHLQKQMQRLFLTKISTVHGLCSDLLREYAYRLDLSADFRVADENECREMREMALADLLDKAYQEPTEAFRAFIDSQGLGRDDRLIPQIIETVYDSARCHKDPQRWLEDCLTQTECQDISDAGQTLWGRFLMEDLKEYLALQKQVMEICVRDMQRHGGLDKQILNFQETLIQITALEQAQTWDEIIQANTITYSRLVFPKKNVDQDLIDRVKAARDGCKKGMEKKLKAFADPSAQVLSDLRQCADSARGLAELVRQFEKDYTAAKRSRHVLDFSDLEHKTLDLLLGKSRTNPTAAASEIGRRYREVLVDEYQDSNGVQDAIFSALTREKSNCFLVGDVKQSIYQFRLADPGIFLEKYHSFLPAETAEPKQGRKVLLSHNFRSGPEVIEGVNQVFATCMRPKVGGLTYGAEEALREGVAHRPLPDAGVELYAIEVREETYPEEAAFVAKRIREMLDTGTRIRDGENLRPVQPEDIVILLRSPGSAAVYFQNALEAQGIRCYSGSGGDLLQTREVATMRAFLQAIANPRLDIPLISVLASPVFGFTADDLAAFRAEQRKGSVYDALLASELPKARAFLETLSLLREEARRSPLTVLLEKCFQLTRMDSIFAAIPNGEAREKNLQAFFQLGADFEKNGSRDLAQFLNHLEALEERGIPMESGSSGCVSIMSIHKSKGLEFPVVFLGNLSRSFNMESLKAQILCHQELGLGLSAVDTRSRIRYPSIGKKAIAVKMAQESISEELRVLYVAMTRARDRLVMTYAVKNLEKDLAQFALRMDFDGGELLCRDAVCMGDWVMLAAMKRLEAGALHALGGRPAETTLGEFPWKIQVVEAPEILHNSLETAQGRSLVPQETVMALQEALAYAYPHPGATQAPSKQTATERKGRIKDAEAAEDTREPRNPLRTWRQPSFREQKQTAAAYGSALHSAMQFVKYKNCGSVEEVRFEIARLVSQGFLKPEQGELVPCESIAQFFATDIGRKLQAGVPHLREFKFSILDSGAHYGEGLEGEQVLLQGVVDCALLEEDGITVLDFKTDRVTEETLDNVAERYRAQVQTYGEALARIYEKPIKGQLLYLFRLNRFVEV